MRKEKILSATRGCPPRYSSLRMSLYAGGDGVSPSEVLGVTGGESRQREVGERTRGENTGLVEEGVMRTEVCFGVMNLN